HHHHHHENLYFQGMNFDLNNEQKSITARISDQDQLHYPKEIENDLMNCGLTEKERVEILATAWEYVRCGVPEFTNWEKYIAFVRLTALTTVAEYRGKLVDIDRLLTPGEYVLGYPVRELLDTLFAGTSVYEAMLQEYASCLLFMAEKTRDHQSDLCKKYIEAIASSPSRYYRLRDCDAQVRLFIAAAVACNDLDPDFTEMEYQAMAEIGITLYDAVAFYKHRAEAEVSNLYAYCGQDLEFRQEVYQTARSTLWALETMWCKTVQGRSAINLLKNLPLIHMSMRRYRFVEDGLTIGKPETSAVVRAARNHVKLWYRNDAASNSPAEMERSFESVQYMLYPELKEALQLPITEMCQKCTRREVYGGVSEEGQFGGVVLCKDSQEEWRHYVRSSESRHLDWLGFLN
uniref:Sesquiterpene synthases n=1 Tax=Shimazuella kribbensis TaxID=139808 RepID=UPI00389B3B01